MIFAAGMIVFKDVAKPLGSSTTNISVRDACASKIVAPSSASSSSGIGGAAASRIGFASSAPSSTSRAIRCASSWASYLRGVRGVLAFTSFE